jgi:hypothetical protein
MKKYTDTFLLFGSLAFLVMWVNEFIYKGTTMKDSYFFLMFALAGFLYYVYRRGQKKMEEKQEAKPPLKKKKK